VVLEAALAVTLADLELQARIRDARNLGTEPSTQNHVNNQGRKPL